MPQKKTSLLQMKKTPSETLRAIIATNAKTSLIQLADTCNVPKRLKKKQRTANSEPMTANR